MWYNKVWFDFGRFEFQKHTLLMDLLQWTQPEEPDPTISISCAGSCLDLEPSLRGFLCVDNCRGFGEDVEGERERVHVGYCDGEGVRDIPLLLWRPTNGPDFFLLLLFYFNFLFTKPLLISFLKNLNNSIHKNLFIRHLSFALDWVLKNSWLKRFRWWNIKKVRGDGYTVEMIWMDGNFTRIWFTKVWLHIHFL